MSIGKGSLLIGVALSRIDVLKAVVVGDEEKASPSEEVSSLQAQFNADCSWHII
jgi:hypothetical protein